MDVNEDVVELEYKELLAEALDEVESPGTFASGGQLQSAPAIELEIEGVGDVHVPLKKHRIPTLVAACEQAPFGKGADTGKSARTHHNMLLLQAFDGISNRSTLDVHVFIFYDLTATQALTLSCTLAAIHSIQQ
jgi:hypothetical protein